MEILLVDWLAYLLLGGSLAFILAFTFIIYLFLKTPVLAFFWNAKGLLFAPQTNRYAPFLKIKKKFGRLVETSNGQYHTRPQDFYIEPKSKTSIAIVYSNYAMTTNPRDVKVIEMLKEMGILNKEHLEKISSDARYANMTIMIGKLPNDISKKVKKNATPVVTEGDSKKEA
jgi:hypothetical protein